MPILKTGIAEMGAYASLYPDVKDVVFPLFQIRPWPNATSLSYTVEKIREAVELRSFGVGLDRDRFRHESNRAAQIEFDSLFDTQFGYKNYFDFVEEIDGAVPVLQPTTSSDTLFAQLRNADRINRGLIVHQRRGSELPLSNAILNMSPLPNDTVIVVDAGWSRDYPALEAWMLPAVQRVVNAIPEAEIVVASSSFPDSFSHIVGNLAEPASERRLYTIARQRFNSADLTYGDWASTRLSRGGGGGKIPSRIDLPTGDAWQIFRADPENDVGFAELAWDAQHHPCFSGMPDCWGKEIVLVTTDQQVGVTSRKVATEARINMHMTVQSGASSIPPTDEVPYVD